MLVLRAPAPAERVIYLFSGSGIGISRSVTALFLTDLFYNDYADYYQATWLLHCLKVVYQEFPSIPCGSLDPVLDRLLPPGDPDFSPSSRLKIYKLFLYPGYEKYKPWHVPDIHRVY